MPYEIRGRSITQSIWDRVARIFGRRERAIIENEIRHREEVRCPIIYTDQPSNISPETMERWRNWQNEREEIIWRGNNTERHTIEGNIRSPTLHDDRVARFNQIGESNILDMPRPRRAWDENIFNANTMPELYLGEGEAICRPRIREVSMADLEAELNEEITVGDEVEMPSTYRTWIDNNSTTAGWIVGGSSSSYTNASSYAEESNNATYRCTGCHKSFDNMLKLKGYKWGVYLCERCNKEYKYLIKILTEKEGNWNDIHYIYDYALFLTNRIYIRDKKRTGKLQSCFTCSKLKRDTIAYKIEGRHRHVYICRCCEPHIQYMMKSIYNKSLKSKMRRLVNMLKNQDEHLKIRVKLSRKGKVYK